MGGIFTIPVFFQEETPHSEEQPSLHEGEDFQSDNDLNNFGYGSEDDFDQMPIAPPMLHRQIALESLCEGCQLRHTNNDCGYCHFCDFPPPPHLCDGRAMLIHRDLLDDEDVGHEEEGGGGSGNDEVDALYENNLATEAEQNGGGDEYDDHIEGED